MGRDLQQAQPEFFIDEIHSFIAFDTAHTVFTFLSNPPYYTNLSYFHLFFFFLIFGQLIVGGKEISKLKLL